MSIIALAGFDPVSPPHRFDPNTGATYLAEPDIRAAHIQAAARQGYAWGPMVPTMSAEMLATPHPSPNLLPGNPQGSRRALEPAFQRTLQSPNPLTLVDRPFSPYAWPALGDDTPPAPSSSGTTSWLVIAGLVALAAGAVYLWSKDQQTPGPSGPSIDWDSYDRDWQKAARR
jgi:hypothetical protein